MWVVHPAQSVIHVRRSPTQIQVLTTADVLEGDAVLPGFRLPLAELFTEPAEEEVKRGYPKRRTDCSFPMENHELRGR